MATAYEQKRTLSTTPEPAMRKRAHDGPLRFVVQKHHATRLHYDVRFEVDGVLKSWAVPKGPSMNPGDQRLAVMVEDHPYDYKDFEGVIPKGNYGAGTVIVWDEGLYRIGKSREETTQAMRQGLEKGHVTLQLEGKKLRGSFSLVALRDAKQPNAWLLIKQPDVWADERAVVTARDTSVKTGRRLEDMDEERERVRSVVAPMLAVTVDAPFDDDRWVYELKWDGYRALADVNKHVQLYSRRGVSFNERFAPIVEALRAIDCKAVLDGEVVMLDGEGAPRFQLLQRYLQDGEESGMLAYYVFDLLFLDGQDMRERPLLERKRLLRDLLPSHPRIRYSDHVAGRGKSLYQSVRAKGLEGIMAKEAHSAYLSGVRSSTWRKVKVQRRQEAVIGGFTAPRGARKKLGALVLGIYEGDALQYIGHTGTGMTDRDLTVLHDRLQPYARESSPFATAPKTNAPVTWVEPKLVCEVAFQEWTSDGRMRKPVYLGVRDDKMPHEVRKETPMPTVMPELTSLDKVFWQDDGYTKGDVVTYYDAVAPLILPYLYGRPESLLRHPNGIAGESFYQKNYDDTVPAYVKTCSLRSESTGKNVRYIICDNKETLLFMAQLGCIEVNPWHSRRGTLDRPDWMVIDLDPNDVSFADVVTVARTVHAVLDDIGVPGYCKTSGKTGMHIYVPLGAQYSYAQARLFSELVMRHVHARMPELTTLERSLDKRPKAVYLDYLQNKRGATLAAPYSVRPVAGATVSAPLRWSEVKKGVDPHDFTLQTMSKRIARVGDLWTPMQGESIDMRHALAVMQKLRL